MTISKEEVAQAIRDWADAFQQGDFERTWAMEGESVGFGYRTRDARPMGAAGKDLYRRVNKAFHDGLNHYRLDFESIETDVRGDVALAWGSYVEDFQEGGHPPERARVRFSQVMQKHGDGWKILLFHRDIQPFDDDGRYPRALTTI